MVDESGEITGSAAWAIETIPQDAILFVFVHKTNVNSTTKQPRPNAFQNTPLKSGTNLSADWNKYSTPNETRQRVGLQQKFGKPNEYKDPNDYYIVSFVVSEILEINKPAQIVEHAPIQNSPPNPDNRSHSHIIGEKDEEVRLKFCGICKWEIAPE